MYVAAVSVSGQREWEQDKINAYMTLYTALVTISKAAAPMIPFMTEDIYRNLVCSIDPSAPESVHLCDFPEVDEAHIDSQLEADMEVVLEAVVIGRPAEIPPISRTDSRSARCILKPARSSVTSM